MAAKDVVLSVTVDPGPVLLMEELHKACKSQFPSTRIVSCVSINFFRI